MEWPSLQRNCRPQAPANWASTTEIVAGPPAGGHGVPSVPQSRMGTLGAVADPAKAWRART